MYALLFAFPFDILLLFKPFGISVQCCQPLFSLFFLNFQLLDAVSQMACLGFEKSYRETVVLMTRSYLDKLKNLDSAESKTMPPEATTERLEVWLIFLKPLFLHDFCLKDANQKSKTIY